MSKKSLNIWIDLSNSPHVLFFEPVISELKKRGHKIHLTARNFCNTIDLIEAKGLKAEYIGKGFEFSKIHPFNELFWHIRVFKLIQYARSKNFDIAVSHCSSSQIAAARKLGIPSFTTIDYEHVNLASCNKVKSFMIPDIIHDSLFITKGICPESISKYSGLKENVYLYNYNFNSQYIYKKFGIKKDEILVTFRPFSDTAHYLKFSNDTFQNYLIEKLASQYNVKIIVLPRTERQRKKFKIKSERLPNIKVCNGVVDGPSLISLSDLVVSGGGTVIREAAILGVPAISFFHGRMGIVDQWLVDQNRLTIVKNAEDLVKILPLKKRLSLLMNPGNGTITSVVDVICKTAD
jgi:predicted glycosyltransferase